jgi:hypothetical protein
MVRYAGADPGFSGAIALLTEDGRDIEQVWPILSFKHFSPSEMKKKDPKKRKATILLDTSHIRSVFVELEDYNPVLMAMETLFARTGNISTKADGAEGKAPRFGSSPDVPWKLSATVHAIAQASEFTGIELVHRDYCTPTSWKSIYPTLNNAGAGIKDHHDRTKAIDAAAIATVQEVFPNSWQKICPPHKSRNGVFNAPNPNWADAVLLASYAKHVYESSLMTTAKVA